MVVLHYIFLSGLPGCLELPIETTGEVSVTCMLIARVAYRLAQALYIDVREHTCWHIHIDATSNTLFFWSW